MNPTLRKLVGPTLYAFIAMDGAAEGCIANHQIPEQWSAPVLILGAGFLALKAFVRSVPPTQEGA